MKKLTLETIINAMNVTAEADSTRYNMQHVRIASDAKDTITIVATDGFVLSDVSVNDPDLAKMLGNNIVYAHIDLKPQLKKLLKETKNLSGVISDFNKDGLVLAHFALGITLPMMDKDFYPDYKQIVPSYAAPDWNKDGDNGIVEIRFNPEYLLALCKALKEDKRQTTATLRFKIYKGTTLTPIAVTVGENSGVIMPCRK